MSPKGCIASFFGYGEKTMPCLLHSSGRKTYDFFDSRGYFFQRNGINQQKEQFIRHLINSVCKCAACDVLEMYVKKNDHNVRYYLSYVS